MKINDHHHHVTTLPSAATVAVEMTSSSVLQGDGAFYNHVISRDSSPSTRVLFYSRSNAADGVPFNWETQPGTPKFIPKEKEEEEESSSVSDPININPPPAVLSLSIPKPSFLITHHAANESSNVNKLSLLWKFLVGKKRRHRYDFHHHRHPQPQIRRLNNVNNTTTESGSSWDNGGDSSPNGHNYSSFSSSTLSHSSSNGGDDDDDDDEEHSKLSTSNSDSSGIAGINSSRSSRIANDHYHRGCGGRPWNFNSLLVCVSGKI